jgi:hypothetical protein
MKAIIGKVLALSGIIVVSYSASAQQNPYAVPASTNANSTVPGSSPSVPVGVSTKVFNSFNQKFANATDVSWNSKSDGTSVSFRQNGIATRSTYDAKGSLEYTIRTFYGTQVPQRVINLARRNGYLMSVMQCTEVTRRNMTTQFVKMENEYSYVTIQIHADGEVTEYESFQKAK